MYVYRKPRKIRNQCSGHSQGNDRPQTQVKNKGYASSQQSHPVENNFAKSAN